MSLDALGNELRRLLRGAGPNDDLHHWARERGWLGESSSLTLQAFLDNELRCARIEKAQQFRLSRDQQSVQEMRVVALCEELGVPTEAMSSTLLARARQVLTDDHERARSIAAEAAQKVDIPPLLETINQSLHSEFGMRREMLLKRCDVTVQSFLWGDNAKGHESEIAASIHTVREGLSKQAAPISVYDAAAVSHSRCHHLAGALDKSGSSATATVKKHLIGDVPNRGGNISAVRQDSQFTGERQRGGGVDYGHGRGKGSGRHQFRRGGGKRSRK